MYVHVHCGSENASPTNTTTNLHSPRCCVRTYVFYCSLRHHLGTLLLLRVLCCCSLVVLDDDIHTNHGPLCSVNIYVLWARMYVRIVLFLET